MRLPFASLPLFLQTVSILDASSGCRTRRNRLEQDPGCMDEEKAHLSYFFEHQPEKQ